MVVETIHKTFDRVIEWVLSSWVIILYCKTSAFVSTQLSICKLIDAKPFRQLYIIM